MVFTCNRAGKDNNEEGVALLMWEPPWSREPGYHYFNGAIVDLKGWRNVPVDNNKLDPAVRQEIVQKVNAVVTAAMSGLTSLIPVLDERLKLLRETNDRLREVSDRNN